MKMAKTYKLGLVLSLFFLIIMPFAFAEPDIDINYYDVNYYNYGSLDFSVFTKADIPLVCNCYQYSDAVQVLNSGIYGARFSVSSDSDFVVFSDDSFELQPGESKNIFVYMTVPCDKEAGIASFNIIIKSNLGPQKNVTKTIDVNRCQNLKVFLTAYDEDIDPCETAEYLLQVQNVGGFEEQYSVDLGDYSGYAEISDNNFEIPAGQSKAVSIKLQPSCEIYGEQVIPFNVHAEKNNLDAVSYHRLKINQNYNYSLFVKTKTIVCIDDESTLNLGIENRVGIANNYSLDLKGAPFLSLEKKKVSLEAFGTESIDIIAKPSSRHKGSYNVSIITDSEIGDTENNLNFNIEVADCHDRQVFLEKNYEKLCVQNKEYPLVIANNGLVDETGTVSLAAPEFATVDDADFSVAPGEQINVPIIIEPPQQDGSYTIKAIVKFSDGETFTKQLKLDFVSTYNCYLVKPARQYYSVDVEDSRIAVKILQKAFQYGEYSVDADTPDWIELEDSEISFTNKSEDYITFRLNYDPTVSLGLYNITLNIENEDSGYNYIYPITVSLHEKPYLVLAWRFVTANACRAAKTALLIILIPCIVALIVQSARLYRRRGMRNWRDVKTPKRKALLCVLILMFVIAAVLVLVFSPFSPIYAPVEYTPQSEIGEDDILYEWPEDEKFTINLFDHFMDPDNDVLRFTSSKPKNMTVDIKDNMVTLMPDRDWNGYRTIIFTASDLRGGVTDSPLITLHVIPREDFTIWDVLSFYCWYVNLVIFFVELLIIYLIAVSQARISALEQDKIRRREEKRAEMSRRRR